MFWSASDQVYSGSAGYILYNDEPAAGVKKKHAASTMGELRCITVLIFHRFSLCLLCGEL